MGNIQIPTKVDEMRAMLIRLGESEQKVAMLNKSDLKDLIMRKTENKQEDEFNFEFSDNDEDGKAEVVSMQDALPKYGSPEWQAYVLSLLQPNEQVDGYPRYFGLRRIAQLLLGNIVSSKPISINVIPQENDGRSCRATTVAYEIIFDWKLDRSIVVSFNGASQPMTDYRTFGGVADCVEDIRTPYGRHPAASAETKAESRALKKALCLNILSAEEIVSGYDEKIDEAPQAAKINSQLIGCIEAKCGALKLDLDKVLKDFGATTPIKNLSMGEGRKLFTFLNEYQKT